MPESTSMVDAIGKSVYGTAWDSMRKKDRQRAEQIANAKSAMWVSAGLLVMIVSLCLTIILLTATARYVF